MSRVSLIVGYSTKAYEKENYFYHYRSRFSNFYRLFPF